MLEDGAPLPRSARRQEGEDELPAREPAAASRVMYKGRPRAQSARAGWEQPRGERRGAAVFGHRTRQAGREHTGSVVLQGSSDAENIAVDQARCGKTPSGTR